MSRIQKRVDILIDERILDTVETNEKLIVSWNNDIKSSDRTWRKARKVGSEARDCIKASIDLKHKISRTGGTSGKDGIEGGEEQAEVEEKEK